MKAVILLSLVFQLGCNLQDDPLLRERNSLLKLMNSLKSDEDHLRYAALESLEKMSKEKQKALIPVLVDAMRDDDKDKRGRVSVGLREIGPIAVPALIHALAHEDHRIRAGAADALGMISGQYNTKVPTSPLISLLKDKSASVRGEAAIALGTIRDSTAIPSLIDLVKKEEDWNVRTAAVDALREFGPKAKAAVPVLIEVIRNYDREEQLRDHSQSALLLLGTSGNLGLGPQAALALASIGPDSVPYLIDVLKSKKEKTGARLDAGLALKTMGSNIGENKIVVPVMLELLNDSEEDLRAIAISVLGNIGPKAKNAFRPLLRSLTDQSPTNRACAAGALYRIDPNNNHSVPFLIKALQEKKNNLLAFAGTMYQIDPKVMLSFPIILAELESKSRVLRNASAVELASIGSNAKAAIPALKEALKDKEVAAMAQYALDEITKER